MKLMVFLKRLKLYVDDKNAIKSSQKAFGF